MTKQPLVSIITATLNSEKHLERSIQSVLGQDYPNIEYIIIDGGSQDGTTAIIEKYSDNITYWTTEKDEGIYDAWNKGLALAKGDWIGFLGSDDKYYPDAISSYVNKINALSIKELDYVSSKVELVDPLQKPLRIIGKPWNWDLFKIYMNVAHVGSLHAKHYFQKYGNYNMNYKITGDYELLLRAKENLIAGFWDGVTVQMQVAGISSRNRAVFEETYRAKVSLGVRTPYLAKKDMWIAKVKYFIRKILFPT